MKLSICQLNSQWENKAKTKERIEQLLLSKKLDCDCLVFPEMTLTGFSMNPEVTTLDTDDHQFFQRLAIRYETTILYGGVSNSFNCIFSVSPKEKNTIIYRKRHLFSFGGEDKVYLEGDRTKVIEIGGMRLGLAICYDLRFSYHFWNMAKDCDAYIVIANWPESRREHWKTLIKARAIENLAYVIGVNRTGMDPKLIYSGDSMIVRPFGEMMLDCQADEDVFTASLDVAESSSIRNKFQFLKDRIDER